MLLPCMCVSAYHVYACMCVSASPMHVCVLLPCMCMCVFPCMCVSPPPVYTCLYVSPTPTHPAPVTPPSQPCTSTATTAQNRWHSWSPCLRICLSRPHTHTQARTPTHAHSLGEMEPGRPNATSVLWRGEGGCHVSCVITRCCAS